MSSKSLRMRCLLFLFVFKEIQGQKEELFYSRLERATWALQKGDQIKNTWKHTKGCKPRTLTLKKQKQISVSGIPR